MYCSTEPDTATALPEQQPADGVYCMSVQKQAQRSPAAIAAIEHVEEDLTSPAAAAFFLPTDLLVLVLQHVGLPHRLGSCARVSTTWHKAALAATHSIRHRSSCKPSTDNLQSWLATHGADVAAVKLSVEYHSRKPQVVMALWGCPKLQKLSLSHITPGPSPASTSSSSSSSSGHIGGDGAAHQPSSGPQGLGFDAFTQLTSLSLRYCCLDSLASLAAITGLRQLRLEKPQPPGYSPAGPHYTLDAAALGSLQHLTSLQVVKSSYMGLLLAICCMTELQELQLVRCKDTAVTAVCYAVLWQQLQHLTALVVEAVPGCALHSGINSTSSSSHNPLYSSSSSKAKPLQKLLRLEVTAAALFDPKLLSAAVQLQHLHLTSTPLCGGPQGTAELLGVLGRMTGLQHLDLKGTLQHLAPPVLLPPSTPPAAAAAGGGGGAVGAFQAAAEPEGSVEYAAAAAAAAPYASLTASSRLQYLDLSRCVLPQQAAQAVFGSNSSWQCNSSSSGGSGRSRSDGSGKPHLPALQQLLLVDTLALHAAADMDALVTACPGLCNLEITRATPSGGSLPPGMVPLLLRLPQLTSLSLCQVDDEAARHLAGLTQLESLSIVWQSSISDEGVQQLTALRRLQQLWVHGDLSQQVASGFLLTIKSQGSPPDVWCQLQNACSSRRRRSSSSTDSVATTPLQE